jgi:ABC-type lipoprotein release transport system permease subunit
MRGLVDIAVFLAVAGCLLAATVCLAIFGRGPELLDVSPRLYLPLAAYVVATLVILLVSKVPISYITGNLAVRWRTTFMTALAFALVTCLLTVMLAFVNGMYALTSASGHPENVIILSEGATDEGFSNLGFGDVGDIENQPGIAREGDRPLVSRETYLAVNQPIENAPAGRPKRRFLQMRGIDDAPIAAAVHGISLFSGSEWFSEAGVREAATADGRPLIEVVLGEGIAREMGKDRRPEALSAAKNQDRLEVGDMFELNDRTWVVTGVMQSSGSTFDSELWAKRALVGPAFGKDTYTTLVARTPSAAEARQVKDYFNTEYKKSAVAAQVETDYFASLSETNKQFLVAIGVVTAFMALGGFFGVMNTMFATISQRIKDIGVLRLLGFRRRHVLATFLLESVAIALVGGAIGCALGSLSDGYSANSIVSGGPGGGKFVVLKLTVDAQILVVGMLLAIVMGFLGGLLPSLRAMRWTALETLR